MSRLQTFKQVYKNKGAWIISVVGFLIIGFIITFFTDFELTLGNLRGTYTTVLVLCEIVLAVLFGINASLIYYLVMKNQVHEWKATTSGSIGSLIGVLVAGCPACGITLASYIGLASFFAAFPLYGLELKFLGIALLLYATHRVLSPQVCKVKNSVK
jgi:hypothetical protein